MDNLVFLFDQIICLLLLIAHKKMLMTEYVQQSFQKVKTRLCTFHRKYYYTCQYGSFFSFIMSNKTQGKPIAHLFLHRHVKILVLWKNVFCGISFTVVYEKFHRKV